MSMRLLGSGGLFMVYILLFARDGLKKLLRRPRHLLTLAGFALFGMITNQLFYLLAVRMTNPGTATVMQCLQIVIIMVYSCVTSRRMPRRRDHRHGPGVLGTLLIATGGDPTTLSIPPWALPWACSALSAGRAFASFPPRSRQYGSMTVTGLAMFGAGIGMSAVVRPWQNMPVMDGTGWFALALLTVVGSFLAYSLYMQGVKEIRFSSSEPHRHDRTAFRHGFERHRFGYGVYAYRSNRIRFDHRHGLPYGLMSRFTCVSDELVSSFLPIWLARAALESPLVARHD